MRVVLVDLTHQKVTIRDRHDLAPYLGGAPLARQMLKEFGYRDRPALDPGQPIVFAAGAFAGRYPSASRTWTAFRSPLTHLLGEASTGGALAAAMAFSGFDALVITGRAAHPVYLTVSRRTIHIKRADPLDGTGTEECHRYLEDLTAAPGIRSIAVNGQGGEKGVRFANLTTDRFWAFGPGAGAVFGSKNLKALVVVGDQNQPMPGRDMAHYLETQVRLGEAIKSSPAADTLHIRGTMGQFALDWSDPRIRSRAFSHNQRSVFETVDSKPQQNFPLTRHLSCVGCPVGCVQIVVWRHDFNPGPAEPEETHLAVDYESFFALGVLSDLAIPDAMALMEKVRGYGLDPAGTGTMLAWLAEAVKTDRFPARETGFQEDIHSLADKLKAIDALVEQNTGFYRMLARGIGTAAKLTGTSDKAYVIGELPLQAPLHAPGDAAAMVMHSYIPPHLLPDTGWKDWELKHTILSAAGLCPYLASILDGALVADLFQAIDVPTSPNTLYAWAADRFADQLALMRGFGYQAESYALPEHLLPGAPESIRFGLTRQLMDYDRWPQTERKEGLFAWLKS